MSDKGKAKAKNKAAKGKSSKGKSSKGAASKTPAGRKAVVRERQAAAGRQAYELTEFSDDIAAHAQAFVAAVRDIATATSPDTAVSELLVQLAQVSMAGSMLGAVQDVVPMERFEADPGPDLDVDPLRVSLADLLIGVDEYVEVDDPLLPSDGATLCRVSDDVADVTIDLVHGLRHYEAGRVDEALWWWQFSYLSTWGQRSLSAHRALLSIVSHQRLDADEDEMVAAQADALLLPD